MNKDFLRSFRFVLMVILIIWGFYWVHSISLKDAVSLTLGSIAGGFLGWLTVNWLKKKWLK